MFQIHDEIISFKTTNRQLLSCDTFENSAGGQSPDGHETRRDRRHEIRYDAIFTTDI